MGVVLSGGLQHIHCAGGVDSVGSEGFGQGLGDIADGGEMEDSGAVFGGLVECVLIEDRGFDDGGSALEEVEVGLEAVAHVIDDGDIPAEIKEGDYEMRADKSGSTGDEGFGVIDHRV